MKTSEYYAEMVSAQAERTVRRLVLLCALETAALILALVRGAYRGGAE